MVEEVVCYSCGEAVKPFVEWRCIRCGSPAVLRYDREFAVSKIKRDVHSMWRYVEFLPPSMRKRIISLGEGDTPLIKASTPNILMKLEYVNPSGSFKDRGSAGMLTSLRNTVEDVKGVCEDSSGNAGASVAAYCASIGLPCVIFGGESMVYEKALQVRTYGAELEVVKGSREEVAATAVREAEKRGYIYVGHAWNPYFLEGMKTTAYEIAEQTGWNLPEEIYLPVSAGTLLIGLINGFAEMVEAGVVEKTPKIVAVQPQANPPLYTAYKKTSPPEADVGKSVADALSLRNPPRLRQMVDMLRAVKGDVEIVSEDEILKAHKQLGWLGVHAEPSSAVAYAAVRRKLDDIVASDIDVLVIVTGMGLKSTEILKLVQ
ncbi:MAG: pyridoxal-phosphate dependent enzyme [Candidatus Caldarchaeum sp.]|nr:pyridoxal-phosphate dependent enzyme [Candidatus Caldarchaeum sp.]